MADIETKEGVLTHREDSPTAASAYNRKFPTSGVQTYRVMAVTGMGMSAHEVEAATGDEAAEAIITRFPGARVAHVEPAPQKAPRPDLDEAA